MAGATGLRVAGAAVVGALVVGAAVVGAAVVGALVVGAAVTSTCTSEKRQSARPLHVDHHNKSPLSIPSQLTTPG